MKNPMNETEFKALLASDREAAFTWLTNQIEALDDSEGKGLLVACLLLVMVSNSVKAILWDYDETDDADRVIRNLAEFSLILDPKVDQLLSTLAQ